MGADDNYRPALAANIDLGRTRGIDATLKEFNLDAILLSTDGVCLRFQKSLII
jgi:amidase